MTDKQMHSKNLSVELDKSRSTATSLIIDGVDVSGCAYFWNKECRCIQDCVDYSGNNSTIKELFHKDTGIFTDCKNSPNCYYKQLKRKEQECEKAKQNAQDTYDLWQALIESFNILQGEKIKLEQECEELKRANLHIENNREHKANKLNRIEKLILACTTGYTDEFLQELLVILHEPEPVSFENKYLQTLAEIKKIITTALEQNTLINLDKILQKINEVDGENM